MGLIIRSSAIHAAGCYTTTPIRRGTRIVEYTGPRITDEEGDERYDNRETTYLFGLKSGMVIDGNGMAAFINHSCEPNCETDEIDGRVWIFALRDIGAGEELSYDYNLYDGDEGDPAPCVCGARNCRGTMYSREEIARRKKKKSRKRRRPRLAKAA
jgi:SET domain-containing protein